MKLIEEAEKFEPCYEYEHCKAPMLIEQLLEEIQTTNHRYLDLQQVCDDQAKQIVTLKAALVDSNVRSEYPRYDELPEEDWEEKRDCGKDDFYLLRYRGKKTLRNAIKMKLARELPEIFGDDK